MKSQAQTDFTQEIAVVNFAGGGGSDDGIERYTRLMVAAAINHDAAAIEMHRRNHPYTEHLKEDVFQVDPAAVCRGRPVGLAWFSPDCTHFSRAKGGTPVKKEIRGLSWVIVRWAMTVRPRVILMENVKEIRGWGPLVQDGKGNWYPDPARKGETFRGFVEILTCGIERGHPALLECCEFLGLDPEGPEAGRLIRGLGYDMDWRELCAADYGVPTIRERFFGVFRCDGRPICWPEPTHAKRGCPEVLAGEKLPWVAAASIIDWSLPAPSIFESKAEIRAKHGLKAKRPLEDNTIKRVARGLDKFVLKEKRPFIVPIGYGERNGQAPRVHDALNPLPTVTAKDKHYLCKPVMAPFTATNTSNAVGTSAGAPVNTVRTGGGCGQMLIEPFLAQYHQEQQRETVRGQPVDRPIMTVDGSNRYAVAAPILAKYYGSDVHGQAAGEPLHTVTARDREGLVVASISKFFGGGYNGAGADAEEPLPTVTAVDHNAVQLAHICKFKGQDLGQHPADPLHTVTASWGEFAVLQTRIARYGQGADMGYWPQVRAMLNQWCGYALGEDEVLLQWINGAWWYIRDIGLRMLTAREAFSAMGFAPDYIIAFEWKGKPYPKSEQMKKCGNAVCPPLAGLLAAANLPEYARKVPLETLEAWRDAVAG